MLLDQGTAIPCCYIFNLLAPFCFDLLPDRNTGIKSVLVPVLKHMHKLKLSFPVPHS